MRNVRDQRGSVWNRVFAAAMPAAAMIGAMPVAPAAMAQDSPDAESTDTAATSQPSVQSLFEDFLHYARIARFEEADAFATRLLATPDLDPVEILRISERDPRSLDTLLLIARSTPMSDNAKRVLDLIREGEYELRRDAGRIRDNIERLGGNPQAEYHATQQLIDAGEFAVPWMVEAISRPEKERLHPRILSALPKLGRDAVNPLVMALAIDNEAVRAELARVLGKLGYQQAIPYLAELIVNEQSTDSVRQAAREAIRKISNGRLSEVRDISSAFFALAEQYYDQAGSVAADDRRPTANVWYWNTEKQFTEPIPVPTKIFGPVMAMRCCERSLRADADFDAAIALWLAGNIRREARLGLDIENPDPVTPDEPDATKPDDFPPSLFFTRAAGPRYAHMVLARAVADEDPAVALGAIAALRSTAGEASLIGAEDYKQPLAQALEFPHRIVRIRAALALGAALPRSPFYGSNRVVPLIAGALAPETAAGIVLVDPDDENRNRLAESLRGDGDVIDDSDFYRAMDRARARFVGGVSAFLIATNIEAPSAPSAIDSLRHEFAFAHTPIIVLVRPNEEPIAETAGAGANGIGSAAADSDAADLLEALADLRGEIGDVVLNENLSRELALEATRTLAGIAFRGNTVLDHTAALPQLIDALAVNDEELQLACASVLSLIGRPVAQQAIADLALSDAGSGSFRIACFEALARSGREFGNLLDEARTQTLIDFVRETPDQVLRSAASQSLGALNLSDNKASEIIRSYDRG